MPPTTAPHPFGFELRHDPATGLPLCPTYDVWAALSPEVRAEVTEHIRQAVGAWQEAQPPEGTPHERAIRKTIERIERHFRIRRKGTFLASNLLVEYPGEPGFAPDLIAVHDVPIDAERESWNVNAEGRGLDFILEVLFRGRPRKEDLNDNVVFYARLGVPEYLVFDGRRRQVVGWRLNESRRVYEPILPQYGAIPSQVLGLEFAVENGKLKVFQDGLELTSADEEIARLVERLNDREVALAAEAERAAAEARARRRRGRARHRRGRARRRCPWRAPRSMLEMILSSRGLTLDAAQQARVRACTDAEVLTRWAARALAAQASSDLTDLTD
jgi:Uma2 family endonuclease